MEFKNIITDCTTALAQSDFDKVFELLTKITQIQQTNRYTNLQIQLQSRYNRVKQESISGTISLENKQLTLNQISHSITELLNDLAQLPSAKPQTITSANSVKNLFDSNLPIKLVIFSANPVDTIHLNLDAEAREIAEVLRNSEFGKRIQIIPAFATRISDLQDVLLAHKPNFVHFAGHGSENGIILLNEQNLAQIVPLAALAKLFSLFKNNIVCVFLNACFSQNQAAEIKKYIPHVVGMNAAIEDNIAIKFAKTFYKGIGAGEEVLFSFEFAKNYLDLDNQLSTSIPVILSDN